MTIELDTFLPAVSVIVDERYQTHAAPPKPVRPGPKPRLSDSEALPLTLWQQWLGASERALGRFAAAHWRASFPHLISQSAFHRRVRDLSGVLAQLAPRLADALRCGCAGLRMRCGAGGMINGPNQGERTTSRVPAAGPKRAVVRRVRSGRGRALAA